MRRFCLTSLTAGVLAAIALAAAAQPASTPDRAEGKVTAYASDHITLVDQAGATTTVKLRPDVRVMISTPIKPSDIKPGSYIGTTNYAKPDGTGRSLEVHVSPPGVKGPGVDFVMDANAGTTMTNGVVGQVVESDGGRVLSVDHGAGVRKITVPATVPVVLNTPSDASHVVPGTWVNVTTFTTPIGAKVQFITIKSR